VRKQKGRVHHHVYSKISHGLAPLACLHRDNDDGDDDGDDDDGDDDVPFGDVGECSLVGGSYYKKTACGSDLWPGSDSGDDDDDDDDDDVCFSGDDTVTLESGLSTRLAELNVGDRILTANKAGVLRYSDVVFLPHETNNKPATFVEMTTSNGNKLRATKSHLIVTCSGVTAYAGSLTTGQCIRTATGDDLIETLATVRSTGIYTAVTKNDFLVVGGIVASPFAWNHDMVSAYYNLHRLAYDFLPSFLHSHALLKANALLGSLATGVFVALAGKNVV